MISSCTELDRNETNKTAEINIESGGCVPLLIHTWRVNVKRAGLYMDLEVAELALPLTFHEISNFLHQTGIFLAEVSSHATNSNTTVHISEVLLILVPPTYSTACFEYNFLKSTQIAIRIPNSQSVS